MSKALNRIEINIAVTVLILALALALYLVNLGEPHYLFWDENYHLTSTHKYLHGVLFMENHPPLGKLLMALSEWAFGANEGRDVSSFLKSDYIGSVPTGYDFMPARFPSALTMALAAPVFFQLMLAITSRLWFSVVLASLFVFNSALLVHGRAVHLEGECILFGVIALLIFVRGLKRIETLRMRDYVYLGLPIGLALATKTNMGVLLLLPFFWWVRQTFVNQTPILQAFGNGVRSGLVTVATVSAVVILVFYIHCGLGAEIIGNNSYQASDEYKKIVDGGETWNPIHLPVMLRDQLEHMAITNAGVPPLRPYMQGENGSHPLLWPFGIKSINYRWDKGPDGRTSYMQLAADPVSWGVGLVGLVLTFSLAVSRAVGETKGRDSDQLFLAYAMLSAWITYVAAAVAVPRVLYLYHYFVPLIFTWCMFAAVTTYLAESPNCFRFGRWASRGLLLALLLAQLGAFYLYAPLAYHLPLTPEEFERLQVTSMWDMKAIR